ncbi:MAG: 3-phenylpropionate/cinnamic acid dioxygenase small subunit [Acidimicrobiales bacterium]
MSPDIEALVLRAKVEAFLFLEARLADESRYDEWLELFDDEVMYWVPKGRADYDPTTMISYINDNRGRLETRVKQLLTGVHYAQTPQSPMRRVISNVEVGPEDDGLLTVRSNFVLYEHSIQASNELRVWAAHATHRLRTVDDGFRIRAKTVELVNSSRSLPTLAFLL